MLAVLAATVLAAAPAQWEETLETVVQAVVQLRTTTPRAFDTTKASNGGATGFVVDAERGLILTNRHVVEPGPVLASAVFQNHEEVELTAVYRDPVHDFGFFRFDPAKVEHMDLVELSLAPESARVGAEIRVVGNDAGEKLSILEGTLARVDRQAPSYGRGKFNDFNTFYFQAASGTSGGSSGSPVVDALGRVIALNAGGNSQSASSFYLPVDRVVRALKLLQSGQPVPRGTLQTTFVHKSFGALGRMGLPDDLEASIRASHPAATGMLTVDGALPQGPADGLLEAGDILLAVDGASLVGFLPLEGVLDDGVGRTVTLSIVRQGAPVEVEVTVQDLHSISPASFVEIDRSVLHDLSYQKARSYNVPLTGVFLATSSGMFDRAGLPSGAVIVRVGEQDTPDLDSFEAALERLPHGLRVPVTWRKLSDWRLHTIASVELDRVWWPAKRCDRNDTSGTWDCTDLRAPAEPHVPEPTDAIFPPPVGKLAKRFARSLVWVNYDIPMGLDGTSGQSFTGTGIVVDGERGLLVVDRNTVSSPLGVVRITVGGSLQIPGKVEFLHPVNNYAIVSYDPALLGDTPLEAVTFVERDFNPGDELIAVGMGYQFTVLQASVTVSNYRAYAAPTTSPPRYRQYNFAGIRLVSGPSFYGGVLVDKKGRVAAQWAAQPRDNGKKDGYDWIGTPSATLLDAIRPLREGRRPTLRRLGAELWPTSLADGRNRGLTDLQVEQLSEARPQQPGVHYVLRKEKGTPAGELLVEGDLVVAVNGVPLGPIRDLEEAAQEPQVMLTVVRDGKTLDLAVPTVEVDGRGTDRAVLWAGALLQAPFQTLAAQNALELTGVYVSRRWYGSPAHRYGLQPKSRIVSVDGTPTPDLDAFLAAVAALKHRDSVRLEVKDIRDKGAMETLKLDLHYWPTVELNRTEDGWVRSEP